MSATPILIGFSQALARLRASVQCVAASEHPVLVTGPTGAGKEVVVRLIHELSHAGEPLLD